MSVRVTITLDDAEYKKIYDLQQKMKIKSLGAICNLLIAHGLESFHLKFNNQIVFQDQNKKD